MLLAFMFQLVFGNCGVLQGIGPGKAYVDMSTVDTETVADIHEVSELESNIKYS